MISIITATYNAGATLKDNLACIHQQTEHGSVQVEHLLIDGGSQDCTLDVIKAYCAESAHAFGSSLQARYISEPDRGIYDAMNKGVKLAQGEIIGILNADDFYASSDVLLKVAKVFEDPAVEACYGDLCYVREKTVNGHSSLVTCSSRFSVVRYWKSGVFVPRQFYRGWMLPHPTFFVRRSVYEKYGLFNLDLGSAADYEIMLRFVLRYRIKLAYIPEVLVQMRVGGVSNATVGNRLKANRNDRKAWEVNGLKPCPWTLFLKPMRKIPQWWFRP
jgi:glycosyltransferase